MTQQLEIYKCEICGNIVEMIHAGTGKLICCGQPMKLQSEKTDEKDLAEKHKPVVEDRGDGTIIKIGEVPHPMEKEHFIEWIEIITNINVCRHSLTAGDKPEVASCLKDNSYIRAYCNVHGLWKN